MTGRQLALALVPKLSGSLSIVFSGLIVYSILRRKNRSRQVYDRLVLGVSLADLLGSFWIALSTWPIPESSDDDNALWASGNQTTCNAQGFFTQGATSASAIYMGSLTTYFLLTVRFGRRNPQLRRCEWCFHAVPVGWGLSTAVAGLVLRLYHDANLWCFIAPSPEDDRHDGRDADFFRMLFFYGPLFSMYVVVTTNALVIVSYVRRLTTRAMRVSSPTVHDHTSGELVHTNSNNNSQEKREDDDDDYDDDDYDDDQDDDDDHAIEPTARDASTGGSTTASSNKSKSSNRYARWRRKVSLQCSRFALAFYFTWTPISCVRMLQMTDRAVPFWVLVLATITTPMQGLPNLLVYFYPRYRKYLKHKKQVNNDINFNLLQWIRAGMATSVATPQREDRDEEQPTAADARDGGGGVSRTISFQNNHNHTGNKTTLRPLDAVPETERVDDDNTPSFWIPKRGPRGVSSITISEQEPTTNAQGPRTREEKWKDSKEPSGTPLKFPARVVSEVSQAATFSRKVSFKEEDDDVVFANINVKPSARYLPSTSSETNGSVPTSILKNSHDSVSVLPESLVYSHDSVSLESDELTPEKGDTSRWGILAGGSDQTPGLPPRPVSQRSDAEANDPGRWVAPAVGKGGDQSPGIPRRPVSARSSHTDEPVRSDRAPDMPCRLVSESTTVHSYT